MDLHARGRLSYLKDLGRNAGQPEGRPSAASTSTLGSILRRRLAFGRCALLGQTFWDGSLEEAYQRYSHRQRRKSLVVVNLVDILLKGNTQCFIDYGYHDQGTKKKVVSQRS
ncbi:hypothetical protein JTE90_024914 [Oedothorax gibbosus]|uniref:Uncharacterized protein n=1 Tax=Oedothorax gibbosus TaxID=931172 RepID=A0AAV6TJE8_9ARAC|nr:hypothetical protein JTE90_024914 [Oedothorax gibbosus]